MKTTAIYENREKDREQVEKLFRIPEFPDDEFYFFADRATCELIAFKYRRIVYGDHGPYIEFEPDQIKARLHRKFNNDPPATAFYEWLYPECNRNLKIYKQLRDVKHLKNPPGNGFKGNREEGYADYIPGMYYINPYDLMVVTSKGLRLQKEDLTPEHFPYIFPLDSEGKVKTESPEGQTPSSDGNS